MPGLGLAIVLLLYVALPLYVIGHICTGIVLARVIPALRKHYPITAWVMPIVLTGTGWMTLWIEDDLFFFQAIGSAVIGIGGLFFTRNIRTGKPIPRQANKSDY